MRLLVAYGLRNLVTRKLTTVFTAGGMALVVFVFAAVLMLSAGLRQTLVQTGSADNVVFLRKGAKAEIESSVERDVAGVLLALPEVARGTDGEPEAAREVVVLITLRKRGSERPSNVVIRGVGGQSPRLRPQVRLVAGRWPRPGTSEIATGSSIARRFVGAGIGEHLRFGAREWVVTGVFDAGATGFSSEIWGDVEQMQAAFRRDVYSLVVARLAQMPGAAASAASGPAGARDSGGTAERAMREHEGMPASDAGTGQPGDAGRPVVDAFAALRDRIGADPRLRLEVKRETRFYEEQSEMMASFLNLIGMVLPSLFALGAVLGAMITMHAAVANRVREIGTLRALGFTRRAVLGAFMLESMLLGALGGALGLALASCMQAVTISTVNFQTFAELAFSFVLTPGIAAASLAFGVGMGLLGGVLPAVRAARLDIVAALRGI